MTNISTSNVKFSAGAAEGTGFLAQPGAGGPYPGLIVIQEFWGLNDHIRDVTERLASEGFVALAVDMYDGRVTKDPAEARALLTAMDPDAALNKLNGAVESLKKNPLVAKGRIGVIGFCMGGNLSLRLACSNKDIRAAAPFYGRIPPDAMLANLSAPVLYFYGEKDQHIPAADVDRLEKFGKVVRYPNSDHAFFNDTRKEVYNPQDAKDAWTRALAFLHEHLG